MDVSNSHVVGCQTTNSGEQEYPDEVEVHERKLDMPRFNSIAAQHFMWSIQALALPATGQEQLFPDFVEVLDELVLDHEEAQDNFQQAEEFRQLTPEQQKAIAVLDAHIEKMSGPENSLWSPEALEAPEWEQARTLAKRVLAEMGWAVTAPPKDRAVYVGPS